MHGMGGLELLLVPFFVALGVADLAVLPCLVHGVLLLRRIRYSLGELLIIFLLTGLSIGLLAKFMPEMHILLVSAFALVVGVVPFWGGVLGLWTAERLGIASPRRRIFLMLRGMLFAYGFIGLVVNILMLPVSAFIFALIAGGMKALPTIAVVFVVSLVHCGVLMVQMYPPLRRAWRASRAEKRRREAEKTAGPPADSPPESADREA